MKSVAQYGAEWCVPCKRMRPIAQSVTQGLGLWFSYVDVEFFTGAVEVHQIKSLPTFIIFEDGEDSVEIARAVGMMSPAKFTEFLLKHIDLVPVEIPETFGPED